MPGSEDVTAKLDELRPFVGGTPRAFGKLTADVVRLPLQASAIASQTCSLRAWSFVTVNAMSCYSVMPSWA